MNHHLEHDQLAKNRLYFPPPDRSSEMAVLLPSPSTPPPPPPTLMRERSTEAAAERSGAARRFCRHASRPLRDELSAALSLSAVGSLPQLRTACAALNAPGAPGCSSAPRTGTARSPSQRGASREKAKGRCKHRTARGGTATQPAPHCAPHGHHSHLSLNGVNQGRARTQSPTTTNYAVEFPAFGEIAGVSTPGVQGMSLALGKPPA